MDCMEIYVNKIIKIKSIAKKFVVFVVFVVNRSSQVKLANMCAI